jgi:ubiquitin C-terminal hydrolase
MSDQDQEDFSCPKCGKRLFVSREIVEIERINTINFITRQGLEKFTDIVNSTTVEAWACAVCKQKLSDEEDDLVEELAARFEWHTELA